MKPRTECRVERYGPASFIAAMITITVVQTATWAWFPIWILNLFVWGLATVLVLPIGFLLALGRGKTGQIGRGMLIGYLATPLTATICTLTLLVTCQLTP